MSREKLRVQRLAPSVKLPRYAHSDDAGLDLEANEATVLGPGERKAIRTGIAIELPPDTEAQIRPRSGLALDHGITVLNTPGTIDAGYSGELRVILINHGSENFRVHAGMRIAQLIIAPVVHVDVEDGGDNLAPTERGEKGFGSTGRE